MRRTALIGLVMVLPLVMAPSCKSGGGFDTGGLPVKTKLEWIQEEPGTYLVIGWGRGKDHPHPVDMVSRGWVQIGWTKSGKRVWMPKTRRQ